MSGARAMPAQAERASAGTSRPRTSPRRGASGLSLAVQIACRSRQLPPAATLRAQIRRWVSATLGACASTEAAIAVRFVTRAEASTLNGRYRARDYAPNVLSFPLRSPGRERAPDGDIAICPAVVAADAREQGRSFRAQLAHMVVHGVLHLAGHDHQQPGETARMQRLESRVLAALGYADPWRVPTGRATDGVGSGARTRVPPARATMRARRPSTPT